MAWLQLSGGFNLLQQTTQLRSGLLFGVPLDPLNVTEALLTFNPDFLEKDGRILFEGLFNQNLHHFASKKFSLWKIISYRLKVANGDTVPAGVLDTGAFDYNVQMFLRDIEVRGLLSTAIKSVSITRDSDLENYRWALDNGHKSVSEEHFFEKQSGRTRFFVKHPTGLYILDIKLN